MKQKRFSAPWPQVIFAFLVFISVLILGFIFRDTLAETVLDSILYVFWFFDLLFKGYDQDMIWLLALVITLVLVLASSSKDSEKSIGSPRRPLDDLSPTIERIPFWRSMVRIRENVIRQPKYFRPELNWLVIRTLVYHQNSNVDDVKDRLRAGDLVVPPEVLELLGMDETPIETGQVKGMLQKIFHRFSDRFKTPRYIPDPRLEKVAVYLESLLEESNEH